MVIPAGADSAALELRPLATAVDNRVVTVALATDSKDYFVGCPAQSLVVIRR